MIEIVQFLGIEYTHNPLQPQHTILLQISQSPRDTMYPEPSFPIAYPPIQLLATTNLHSLSFPYLLWMFPIPGTSQ